MELRQLELFLAVMECSSITRAAEKVHLSPGAISLQLRSLAIELHTDLFARSGIGLVPTPDATRLLERARVLIRQAREIEEEFRNVVEEDTRPFHFATGATTLIHLLGKPLRRLRTRFPNASLKITVASTEEMVAGVLDYSIDLALVTLPVSEQGLNVLPLFDEELFIIRPSLTVVRSWKANTVDPSQLASASFLLYPKRRNMRALTDRLFADLKLSPKVGMEVDDAEVMRRLVEAGFGWSILPEFALRRGPRFFEVFRVPGHKVMRSLALIMASSERPRALTESIAQLLKSALATPRDI